MSLYSETSAAPLERNFSVLSKKMYDSESHSCFKDWFVCSITWFASLSFFRGKIDEIIIWQSEFMCLIVPAKFLYCLTKLSVDSPSDRLFVPT